MSLKPKKKICLGCGLLKHIFSKGKCSTCCSKPLAQGKPLQNRTPLKVGKGFKSRNKHSKAKKEARKGLPEFFQEHCRIISEQGHRCQNCGGPLQGSVTEVAHILPKGTFPEVMMEDDNILYLCFYGGCHNKFDSVRSSRQSMPVYELAVKRVKSLLPKIKVMKESLNEYLQWKN